MHTHMYTQVPVCVHTDTTIIPAGLRQVRAPARDVLGGALGGVRGGAARGVDGVV